MAKMIYEAAIKLETDLFKATILFGNNSAGLCKTQNWD